MQLEGGGVLRAAVLGACGSFRRASSRHAQFAPTVLGPGHLLDEREQVGRKEIVDGWMEQQKRRIEPMLQSTIAVLTRYGVEPERITTKTIYDSTDVAVSILEQARDGQYLTRVLGRCGSPGGGFPMGSTTSRIINRAVELAVCVVD